MYGFKLKIKISNIVGMVHILNYYLNNSFVKQIITPFDSLFYFLYLSLFEEIAQLDLEV